MLSALTHQEIQTLLLFGQKEEREDPHLTQLCLSLVDQVGQELTWLSCSGLEVVLSELLWDGLTEERLSQAWLLQIQGDPPPVISEPTPFGHLLFWSFEESINILVLVPNFLNGKPYLGQILCICVPMNHSNHPPR